MAFYENTKVRENLTGSTADTTYDTLIANKGTEADNWIVRKLTEIYERSSRIKELPIFDITNGKINGATAPQDIKDLSTNRTTFLGHLALHQYESAKEYKEMSMDQLATIERGLHTTEDTSVPAAIV